MLSYGFVGIMRLCHLCSDGKSTAVGMNVKVAADRADIRHPHNSFLTSSSRSPHDDVVVVFNA